MAGCEKGIMDHIAEVRKKLLKKKWKKLAWKHIAIWFEVTKKNREIDRLKLNISQFHENCSILFWVIRNFSADILREIICGKYVFKHKKE